jgi:hypothetical protein
MEEVKSNENVSTPPPVTGKEMRWQAYEYLYHEKTIDWYWYFGLVAVILIASALYLHNLLFAFIIGIASFIMLMYSNKHPKVIEYSMNEKRISFENSSYEYRDILYFFIVDNEKHADEKLLLLQLKKTTSTLVMIPLGDAPLDDLRTFLLNFIEEKELAIPFGYTFMNIIGF